MLSERVMTAAVKEFGRAWREANGRQNVQNCSEHDMGDCPYHKKPGARRRAGLEAVFAMPEVQREIAARRQSS